MCQPERLDQVEQRDDEDGERGLAGDEPERTGEVARRRRSTTHERRPTARPRAARRRRAPPTRPRSPIAGAERRGHRGLAGRRARSTAAPTACPSATQNAWSTPSDRASRTAAAQRDPGPQRVAEPDRARDRVLAEEAVEPPPRADGGRVGQVGDRRRHRWARSASPARNAALRATTSACHAPDARRGSRRRPARAPRRRPRRTRPRCRTRCSAAARAPSHAAIGTSRASSAGSSPPQHPRRRRRGSPPPTPPASTISALSATGGSSQLLDHHARQAREPVDDLAPRDVVHARARRAHRHERGRPQRRAQRLLRPGRELVAVPVGSIAVSAARSTAAELARRRRPRCARSAPTTGPAAP